MPEYAEIEIRPVPGSDLEGLHRLNLYSELSGSWDSLNTGADT